MDVLGVDCAPGKGSTVFDGVEFRHGIGAHQLVSLLTTRKDRADGLLVCWDAPLTGPAVPDRVLGSYTQRPIESLFNRQKHGFNTRGVSGISVQGYASCVHWTVSRAVLGLPRVGPYDQRRGLPFELIADTRPLDSAGEFVTEVHPAVALWLWSRARDDWTWSSWRYKGSKAVAGVREALAITVLQETRDIPLAMDRTRLEEEVQRDDDALDAFVSYVLGQMMLRGEARVLGRRCCGSFLLPVCNELEMLEEQLMVLHAEECEGEQN